MERLQSYQQKRAYVQSKNKYVDLKVNGRLFPSFLMANFKNFRLPEIIRKEDEDPCNVSTKLELRKYQLFLSKYLDYRSPYRDILIYHGLGSGKTATAINIYNMLYNYTPGWNVFVLIKASLKNDPWLKDIKTWLAKDEYDFRYKNFIFVHYDSPFADRDFLDAVKNADSSKKSLFIIDECHNFIRNVYSNISSKAGKRASTIYDYIIQDKRENEGTRVVCISGTPAINTPYELALLFNMLRPGSFPKSENEFNQIYISDSIYPTISKQSKNMYQRRIMGLVSYYIGATPDLYATKKVNYVDVPMSPYQKDIYGYFESVEDNIAKKSKGKSSMFMSYTRQACNFVFPAISQKVTGENRPRPNKFKISEREAMKLLEGDDSKLKMDKANDKFMNVSMYLKTLTLYTDSFDKYIAEKQAEDQKNKHSLYDDYNIYLKTYEGDFVNFINNHKKTSAVFKALTDCSRKFVNIIFNILQSVGPTLVYSNYVLMEGFEVFKIYLKYFDFHNATKGAKNNGKGYVEFHGGIKDRDQRTEAVKLYNQPDNMNGAVVKIILISPAGAEGLSLKNCRQVHITEPYWHEVRIVQMIGRAVRQCSHKDLPMDQRTVDVFRYRSIRENDSRWTTDLFVEDVARSKEGLVQSFLDTLKEIAIDCMLFKNHNMMMNEYKCFQFEQPSLFQNQISSAYKEDLYDDVKMNNGSNSTGSLTVKIKVMEIMCVLLENDDPANPIYSKNAIKYWYHPESHIVYDHTLHYPVGKIKLDDAGIPEKASKEHYILSDVIPIPMLDG